MPNNRDVGEVKRYNLRPRKPKKDSESDERPKTTPRKKTSNDVTHSDDTQTRIEKRLLAINTAVEELVTNVTEDVIERVVQLVIGDDEDDDDDLVTNVTEDEDDEDFNSHDFQLFDNSKMIINSELWKKGLTEDQIGEYSYIFEKLKNRQLSIPKILNSKLTKKEKEEAIYIFLHYQEASHPYEEVIQLVNQREKQEIKQEQLQKYDELSEKLSSYSTNRMTLKHTILDLDIDIKHKSIIWEKYQSLQQLEPNQNDYHKLSEWLNWVTKIPWGVYHEYISPIKDGDPNYQKKLRKTMATILKSLESVYGLQSAKEEILLHVIQKFTLQEHLNTTHKKSGGQILAIEGPPGVGKTYLLKQLASTLKIPFESIPLGGCKDASYLDGHSYTYEGSMPGRLVQALKNMKCSNGIIYFDEIDKISESNHGQEVSSLMLHVLDETQNIEFYDKYLSDIPVDLSKIFFVLSINNREKIDPVLRQRLHIIKIPAPKINDKIQIAKRCIIPMIVNDLQLSPDDVIVSDEIIRYIITSCAIQEEGVRSLKQTLLAIYKRVFFLKHTLFESGDTISFALDKFKLPIVLNKDHVNTLLKNTKNQLDMNIQKMYL